MDPDRTRETALTQVKTKPAARKKIIKKPIAFATGFFGGDGEIRLINVRLGPALAGNAHLHCIILFESLPVLK